jgi:hypothetical protein
MRHGQSDVCTTCERQLKIWVMGWISLHDPRGSTSKGTGESQHLDTSVTSECGIGNDTVLDGIGGTSTDRYSTEHFEYGTEDHGLSVG